MKKMWILLGVILLVELILYFLIVAPQAGVIEQKSTRLSGQQKRLRFYERKKADVPTMKRVDRLKENKEILEKEREACLAALEEIDRRGLKKWFPELGVGDWSGQPSAAAFQPVYKDQFNALRSKCGKKNIEITSATLLPSKEELEIIRKYQRAAGRAGRKRQASETERADKTGGFWETNNLNNENLRAAQKQYWIQEAFVEALTEAKATRLVYVSFHREGQRARGAGAPVQLQGVIVEHFERIPMKVLARMPYGEIATMMSSLNRSGINMEFKGLKVIKPLLTKIATKAHPSIVRPVVYEGAEISGVLPKVFDKNDGVDFGSVVHQMRDQLPDQDELFSEPPVLVEFSYDVLDMKADSTRRGK